MRPGHLEGYPGLTFIPAARKQFNAWISGRSALPPSRSSRSREVDLIRRRYCLDAPAARRSAYSMASIRLSSLAMPLPAISKAVPWSTEVGMIGSLSVMLTPENSYQRPVAGSTSKPNSLTRMCP